MSTDVMRNPPSVQTTLTWYRPSDTTPFAVSGIEGTVLAVLREGKYGAGVQEIWFLGGQWEDSEGGAIDEDDILAFAVPEVPDLEALGVPL